MEELIIAITKERKRKLFHILLSKLFVFENVFV